MTTRWFRLVTLATLAVLIALGSEAHAQVFKPRGGKPASRAAPAATAPAARKGAPVAAQAATSSKKPTRAGGPTTRAVPSKAPAKKAKAGKGRDGDDVKIEDDDDDVKITDD